MIRGTTCIPRSNLCSKPNIDTPCESNPPKNEIGFADGCLDEKALLYEKIIGKIIFERDSGCDD